MATHDITLPAATRPSFPPRCVGCELEHPTSSAKISVTGVASSPSLVESALGVTAGVSNNTVVHLEVPACPKCGKSLRSRHFWKTFWLYVGALGGVALFVAVVALTNSVWLGLIGLGVGVIGPVAWEFISPPAFTVTPMGERVIYEFRSAACAREFQELNVPPNPAETA